MQSKSSLLHLSLRFYFRLSLSMLLLVSFFAVVSASSKHAYATAAQTLTVTDCSGESGQGQIGSVLSSASAGDTITFSCSGTIPIISTLMIGTNNLTLDGRGQSVTLDGGGSTQVISVESGITFTLNALTIAHGFNSSFGGGLVNQGTVAITNSTFTGNTSDYFGGGVGNYYGTITITNSTFTGNTATKDGGGLANYGMMTVSGSTFTSNTSGFYAGALYSNNMMTITNSTFTSNSSEYAGGLFNDGNFTTSTMTISNSTFDKNSNYNGATDGGLGGAILTEAADFTNSATLTVSDSTFTSNSSVAYGGGVDSFGGTVTITNSTFTNNTADLFGGGIAAEGASSMNISNSTIAFNSTSGVETGGGGIADLMSTVSISGSIVAENSAWQSYNCYNDVGTNSDKGYNLSSDSSCNFTGTGDLRNTNPRFDPNGLQNNGGPTQTLALEPGSPAVDHIPVGSSCPATDQRGVSRPQGPACDIGAFEMTTADGLTVMINVVNSFQLSQSIQTTLDNQLQKTLTAVNQGHTQQACSDLATFLTDVRSYTGNGLTTSQATDLRIDGFVIKARLGC